MLSESIVINFPVAPLILNPCSERIVVVLPPLKTSDLALDPSETLIALNEAEPPISSSPLDPETV